MRVGTRTSPHDPPRLSNAFIKAGGDVLVCGWRAAWNTSAIRLKHRVDDLASKLRPRARVIFMNSHARDEVARALAACGYTRRPADDGASATTEAEYVTSAGVVIVHVVGDATSPRDLEPLVVGAPARATGRAMRFALCVRARAWLGGAERSLSPCSLAMCARPSRTHAPLRLRPTPCSRRRSVCAGNHTNHGLPDTTSEVR